MQWKFPEIFPEIYEDDLKLLLMGDKEPEPVIFCNQARLLMDELGHQPSHKSSIYNLSSTEDILSKKGGIQIVNGQPIND